MHNHKERLHEHKHSFKVSFPEKPKSGKHAYEEGYMTEVDEDKIKNVSQAFSNSMHWYLWAHFIA
jgi:hypothetical protein